MTQRSDGGSARGRRPTGRGRAVRRASPVAVAGRVVIGATSLAVFGTSGFTWYTYHSLTTGLTTSQALDTVKLAAPPRVDQAGHLDNSVNLLLIGLDSRRDQDGKALPQDVLENELHAGSTSDIGGYNTNTLILMHIPANGGKVEAFSIPRDDYVDLINAPGQHSLGKHKIKEAYDRAKYYAEGELSKQGVTDPVELEHRSREAGRQATLLTVQNFLQVPIDHFAEVNLIGFYHVADVLKPIEVCLKHAVKDPIVARTATTAGHGSGADFAAGPQELNAAQALSFVRQRYGLSGGDLDRTHRQQAFIAGVTQKLKGEGIFGDLGKMQSLIDVAKKDVVIDNGWNVLDFAQQVPNLTGGNVEFNTLPIETQPDLGGQDGDVNTVDVAKIRGLVRQQIGLSDPSPTPAAPATTGAPAPTTAPAAPATVDVDGGTSAKRDAAAADLAAQGYTKGQQAAAPTRSRTTVTYGSGAQDAARQIAQHLGVTAAVASGGGVAAGHVLVTLGADYTPPATASTATTAGGDATSTDGGSSATPSDQFTGSAVEGGKIPCVN